MRELRPMDRKYLRRLAHHLKPVARVGRAGVTEGLVASVDVALADHELIKIRFTEHKDARKAFTEEIARRTGSAVAGIIGNVAIVYRPNPDKEEERIELPSGPSGDGRGGEYGQ